MGSPELLYKSKMENVALSARSATSNYQTSFARQGQAVTSSSDNALQFISCHHFIGSVSSSSSPAHWHEDIEIIHCISGEGFNHTCQGVSESFDAPAIVIVPSNLIHRTVYPPKCRVTRIKFNPNHLLLKERDNAFEQSISMLTKGTLRGSMIIKSQVSGFNYLNQIMMHLEGLINPDMVPSLFDNHGSGATPESSVNKRPNAINAGSIAIAYASTYNRGNDATYNHATGEMGVPFDIHKERSFMQGRALQIKAALLQLLGATYEYGLFLDAPKSRRQRANCLTDIKLKQLLTYVHHNYTKQMSVSELSQKLNVTNQYFCRLFKQMTNMSFIDYINDLRLQRAAVDIATTDLSIREISSGHGFDTLGYFFKLFRERYNTTPVRYRKSCLEDANRHVGIFDRNNGLLYLMPADAFGYAQCNGNSKGHDAQVAS